MSVNGGVRRSFTSGKTIVNENTILQPIPRAIFFCNSCLALGTAVRTSPRKEPRHRTLRTAPGSRQLVRRQCSYANSCTRTNIKLGCTGSRKRVDWTSFASEYEYQCFRQHGATNPLLPISGAYLPGSQLTHLQYK